MTTRLRKSAQKGFTLIEVVAALTLLAILISMVYGSVSHATRVRIKMTSAVRNFEEIQGLFDRMRQDLQGAYSEVRQKKEGSGYPHTVFLIESQEMDGMSADLLSFSTLSNQVFYLEGEDHNGFAHSEISYDYEQADDEDGLKIYRRQDATMDQEPLEGGRRFLLARQIRGASFRAFDASDKTWVESWDSRDKEGRLPLAVEVTLWYGGIKDEADSWMPIATVIPMLNENFGTIKTQLSDVVPKGSEKAAGK